MGDANHEYENDTSLCCLDIIGHSFNGNKMTGKSVLNDVYDEVAAYKAEYAYSPQEVIGLPATIAAHGFESLTIEWLQGLKDQDGSHLYTLANSSHLGMAPVNINSTRDELIKAYPDKVSILGNLPASYTPKSDPNLIYKH
jgi:hypothetical protein